MPGLKNISYYLERAAYAALIFCSVSGVTGTRGRRKRLPVIFMTDSKHLMPDGLPSTESRR